MTRMQWEKLDPYRYWRKHGDVDLFVTLDADAVWGWDAFRWHKRLTGKKSFDTHRLAMRGADQWTETHLATET